MRSSLTALLGLCLCTLAAQPTPSVRIATAGERTKFYLGEAIPIEIRFSLDTQQKWHVASGETSRTVRMHRTDEFIIEPSDGTADPLADRTAMLGGVSSGRYTLSGNQAPPIQVSLNEWRSIRKPGVYTVALRTKRVSRAQSSTQGTLVELLSEPIRLEIAEPPPGWAAETLKQARAVFAKAQPGLWEHGYREAARTLRFLETEDAARAMVEIAAIVGEPQLIAGLWGSPHRELVIRSMESSLVRSDLPVDESWLGTLVELSALRELPAVPPYPADDPVAQKEWDEAHRRRWPTIRRYADRYSALLLEALPKKTPEARTVCVLTLWKYQVAILPAVMLQTLHGLAPTNPLLFQFLYSDRWAEFASVDLIPLLERIATHDPSMEGDRLRPIAIERIHELDPTYARKLLLREIPRARAGSPLREQFFLPDRELPELDEFSIQSLARENPSWAIIARYATRRPLSAVLAKLDKSGERCESLALLYLYRVAPEEAARRRTPACWQLGVPGNASDFMSDGFESALLEDLKSETKEQVRYAAMLLGQGGSPRVEEPLWQAMEKWRPSFDDRSLE